MNISWLTGFMRRYGDLHNYTCNVCGAEIFGEERLCPRCYRALEWNDGNICPLCGRKVLEAGVCLECKDERLNMDKARSPLLHEGEAARLVVRFKRGARFLYRTAADLVYPTLEKEFPETDLIGFVPMTKRAVRRRGYNQSKLIAEELSRRSGIPVFYDAEKLHDTPSQKFLGSKERKKNLIGCFHLKVRKPLRGKRVLLIDDTMTTGATLSELAGVISRAGAAEVNALTVTSTQYKHPFGYLSEELP